MFSESKIMMSFFVSKQDHKRLKEFSVNNDIPMAVIMRQAISEKLDYYEGIVVENAFNKRTKNK